MMLTLLYYIFLSHIFLYFLKFNQFLKGPILHLLMSIVCFIVYVVLLLVMSVPFTLVDFIRLFLPSAVALQTVQEKNR